MSKLVTIRKDVQVMRRAILPRPPTGLVVNYPWRIRKPHGRYGYQRVIIKNDSVHHYEAVDEETERARMRDFYDSIPKYAKRLQNKPGESGVDWSTFGTYLKGHECKCGRFGHVSPR